MESPVSLNALQPLIRDWFQQRFGEATEPQQRAWPAIRSGEHVLISAPTGSGKTLAAFLVCLDDLARAGVEGTLPDTTQVLYVSPLKALSNDIHKNLDVPLSGIASLAAERGLMLPEIRTAVRTGDTPASERQRMIKHPPHILVTTPESLFILLTADRSRQALRTVRTVIVDEIHAMADDKRGAHLALSLARLDDLVEKAGGRRPQRIGLSATVRPIETVARFLAPDADEQVTVINHGHRRAMDLAVEVPKDELGPVASNEMWQEIYDRITALIQEHRTTLVFVNTRRLAERVAHHLGERLGEEAVLAHHGSLSRKLRLTAEERLKTGKLKAVVATASLELGIDIGTVDLVCQVGSPRSIAVALQRIGRSGHQVEHTTKPKGRIFATTRDELVECAALVRSIAKGELDRLIVPVTPLDVLAQQIVAMAAAEDWREDDLFRLVRRAYCYGGLTREEFDSIVEMLSEGISTKRGRSGAFLHRDRVHGVVRGRRGARLAAITSGGAIPDNAQFLVLAEPDETVVGTLDEDFAVESMAGDVFLLGTTSWRIRRVEAGRVRVEDARGAAPTIPFWRGEAPGRTWELSTAVSDLRAEILEKGSDPTSSQKKGSDPFFGAVEFVIAECHLDTRGAEQAVQYVRAGAAALGALPTVNTVVAERFFDEGGGMQLVLHSPFGARINRAWGLALRKRFCRSFNFELQAAATDNGIVISLSDQHSFPLELVFKFLSRETVEDVLTQAMLPAPMFEVRWRWDTSRALAVLRFAGGRKVPPQIQRMRADDLLAAVFPDQAACQENIVGDIRIPDHPLVNETIKDCLHEAMDLDGLKRLIEHIAGGQLKTVAIDTPEPSPFSHEILNANPYAYLDDAPLEERRARAVQMRRTIGPDAGGVGALDPAAIAEVAAESFPAARDAEELHDALVTLVILPPVLPWEEFFRALRESGRATVLSAGGANFWVAAERLKSARLLYPDSVIAPEIADYDRTPTSDQETAVTETLRGWLESSGPQTQSGLSQRFALPADVMEAALLRLEAEGQILRGRFTAAASPQTSEIEWCNRRVLARIHRLTLGRLRREIEPVTSRDFMRFLYHWQHLKPGTQLHGPDGALHIIKQLQGYEVSAAAWEGDVLRRRLGKYAPELLDQLCISGEVVWGRLSPHPAFDDVEPGRTHARRVRPTRSAPIALFLREDASWLLEAAARSSAVAPLRSRGLRRDESLSGAARQVSDSLSRRGASFLADLVKDTRQLTSGVEDALWELAAAGLVTADGFENLRALIDPKRRLATAKHHARRARFVPGRWALLRPYGGETAGFAGSEEQDPAYLRGGGPDVRGGEMSPGTLEAIARQLLLRWGVVFRDLLARETITPAWRDLLVTFRRMEAQGEIRGGRFVSGFVGEQFARPEAVELLREIRRDQNIGAAPHVSAADPLNLGGIITPGPRISPLSGLSVALWEQSTPDDNARMGSDPVLTNFANASHQAS
ncbi:MAG: DEAD/DEAH box helicase [Acidobacteria bacterium]|nr:MAG: DEAD/DEAH box helicase [Acidobacteriota bacterium]